MNNVIENSLLYLISHSEYRQVESLTRKECEYIASHVSQEINLPTRLSSHDKCFGQWLINECHNLGIGKEKFVSLMNKAIKENVKTTYYHPSCKVAILIANESYTTKIGKLFTPLADCQALKINLEDSGFIVIIIQDTTSAELKIILNNIVKQIPEDSYCFIFFAGHGCAVNKTSLLLGVDCPLEDISMEHCTTEYDIVNQVYECKPELCVFVMDMCTSSLSRDQNPKIYSEIKLDDNFKVHNFLTITYSAQDSAFEESTIESTKTIEITDSYVPNTEAEKKVKPGLSQYVKALCENFNENRDINSMLDLVHESVGQSRRTQLPKKVQYGSKKRSIHDKPTGNKEIFYKLREISERYNKHCSISFGME